MKVEQERLSSNLLSDTRNYPLNLIFHRKMLTKTTIGARICVTLLDQMVKLYDAEEASDGAKAFDVG